MKLSVVICAYTLDRWAQIVIAVRSVQEQTTGYCEILLVCDHNSALLRWAEAQFSDIRVLANASTRGLSGARNTGVLAAAGDIIAFLDDDAIAAPDWAAQLQAAYQDDDAIGVGGRVLPLWEAPRPPWLPEEFLWVVGCSYAGQPSTRAPIRNAIGANMSFRAEVFAAVGLFDVGVGRIGKDAGGCEETELSIRAARMRPGAKIVLEPTALCQHLVTPDRLTRQYFRRRCRAEGRAKAVVSTMIGAGAALESERDYVRRVLPRGVVRGLRELLRGDVAAGRRAAAILEGLFLTGSSYLAAVASLRIRSLRTRAGGPGG